MIIAVHALEEWFGNRHITTELISDNGKEFMYEKIKTLCCKYEIKHEKLMRNCMGVMEE